MSISPLDQMLCSLPACFLLQGTGGAHDYPQDITMRDDGSPAGMFGRRCHPSLASARYRELSHKAMIAFHPSRGAASTARILLDTKWATDLAVNG